MTEGGHVPLPCTHSLADQTTARNAWIEVDLGRLEANVRHIRSALAPGAELIAILKANAYGHGAAGVVRTIEEAGASRLAVAWADEGVALREAGAQRPILVLGHAFPADAQRAVASDLTLTIHSRELAEAISAAAAASGRRARVHIKVDTGLHRSGLPEDAAVALAEAARALPGIEVEGLWTHMANADEADDSFSDTQQEAFARAIQRLPWIPYRHTANSATGLRRHEYNYNGVRAGLALWGVVPEHTPAPPVLPVMSLKARVARVVEVAEGEGVSYGLTWRAERPSRLALIPVGYGDGWRRGLSSRGSVLIAGERCPIAGRVCMDQFLVDITSLDGVREGDVAVLLGSQGGLSISPDEVAAELDTIAWEVLAGLTSRLPRLYHRDGLVEGVLDMQGYSALHD